MAGQAAVKLNAVKNLRTDFRLRINREKGRWWSVLLKLERSDGGISIDDLLEEVGKKTSKQIVVPDAYSVKDRAAQHVVNFVSLIAKKSAIKTLNDLKSIPMVSDVVLGHQLEERHIDFSASPAKTAAPEIKVAADTVIMAVIDDGVAIAHELFLDSVISTRIQHAEIFAVEPDRKRNTATYGRRLTKAGIDALLKKHSKNGLLDERAFYRATGQIDYFNADHAPVAQRRSHGTHVTAIAAGYGVDESVKNRPILCACLPPAVTSDVSGQTLLPSLALALHSIASAARQFTLENSGIPAPVVLNFSYGNTAGPHDGTDLTSQLLEWQLAISDKQKSWVVLPAGNENLGQTHAVLPFGANPNAHENNAVSLKVLTDDQTASHVELWMPFDATEHEAMEDGRLVEITVTTPCGEVTKATSLTDGERKWLLDSSGCRVGQIGFNIASQPTARGYFSISLAPTSSLSSTEVLAPSGTWTIAARSEGSFPAGAWLDVRVHRDESVPGYQPGGRQSYFVDPNYQKFGKYGRRLGQDPVPDSSYIHRSGTISGFACGQSPLVVASVTESTKQPSDYSAAGPITQSPNSPKDPKRVGPDVGTKADDSLVMRGVISAGSSNGSYVRMTGTSVAAPRIARFAADKIGTTKLSARRFVYAFCDNPEPNNPRIGAGVIEVPISWESYN